MSEDRLLTSGELAKALRISRRSIARYAEKGQLVPELVTPGGWYMWDLDQVKQQLRVMREQ